MKKDNKKYLNHAQYIEELVDTTTVLIVKAKKCTKPVFVLHEKFVEDKAFLIQGRTDFLA